MKSLQEIISSSEAISGKPSPAHLIRFNSYKSIEKVVKEFNPSGVGLTIADWRPIIHSMMGDVQFYNLRYPEYNIMDMDNIPENSVDVFYSEMVLEHIESPQKAIDETYRILKPGGIGIHTTVFIMPYHPCPIDLYRFSPDLLQRMHKDYSKVYAGGDGNWRSLLVLLMRATRIPIKYPKGNLISKLLKGNNPKYIITTWVVAQK